MLDSSAKLPENRIHLFDPVGLINDGYGGTYRSSNYASRPRRPTKSYGNFEEVNSNLNNGGGLISYDSFNNNVIDPNGVTGIPIRSYDSFTDGSKNTGLRSYNSFSMEANNIGGKKDLDYNNNNNSNNNNNNININNVDDRNNGVEIRFGVVSNVDDVEDDNDDVCTPRLWKSSSPPKSPKSLNNSSYFNVSANGSVSSMSMNSSPVHPANVAKHQYQHQHQHQHQSVSQSSRTQAIAKGRRELMDMVRDMPESFYELSLKDIVDKKAEFGAHKTTGEVTLIPEEKNKGGGGKESGSSKAKKSTGKKVKKSESKKKMMRSRSVDNNGGRFFLRSSVFPIFSRSKKNKKRFGGSNSFKVAPMPKTNSSSNGSMKAVEKDWWKKKSGMSGEGNDNNGLSAQSASSSGSSISSSRSSSSNERRSSRFLPTCCLFNGRRIRSKK